MPAEPKDLTLRQSPTVSSSRSVVALLGSPFTVVPNCPGYEQQLVGTTFNRFPYSLPAAPASPQTARVSRRTATRQPGGADANLPETVASVKTDSAALLRRKGLMDKRDEGPQLFRSNAPETFAPFSEMEVPKERGSLRQRCLSEKESIRGIREEQQESLFPTPFLQVFPPTGKDGTYPATTWRTPVRTSRGAATRNRHHIVEAKTESLCD